MDERGDDRGADVPGAAALSVRDIDVHLRDRRILHQVTLEAERGSVTAVLGPNGAGKTTLLRAVLGLVPYDAGRILVAGEDLEALPGRERAQRVAYVPQRSALEAPLAVDTVVGHGRYAHTRSAALTAADRDAIGQAMEATDIAGLAARAYTELSGGEQRRVLIARALATGARILLLDEPTASLDVGHALALFALLRRLAHSGVCVVVVLHDLNSALAHTDHAVLLDQGRVAAAGPTPEVITDGPIRRVYGVEPVPTTQLCFRLPDADADT